MQGLININGRQRIILVSNMPEKEVINGRSYEIETLSKNHPNTVFFTEERINAGENIGNNIWKGGVNFTRVHGVDPEACSVTIGDELITLLFNKETGLISLVTGTRINKINFIGFLNYKDNDFVDNAENDVNDEIYSEMFTGTNMTFMSPVNKVALYLQFEPLNPNGYDLSSDPSRNTIAVPKVIIKSEGDYIAFSDNVTELLPYHEDINILRRYAEVNGNSLFIDNRLPVYKYTVNIVNYSGTNPISRDLKISPLALKENDVIDLYAFNQALNENNNSVIIRETPSRTFSISPIKYNLAIHTTQVFLSDTEDLSHHIDLRTNQAQTINLEYRVNNDDQSGQNIKARTNLNSIISYKFFAANKDVTDTVLSNTEYVTVKKNENGKLSIEFKQGFSMSPNGFDALTIKAIPNSFDGTYNYAKYIGPNSDNKFTTTISNYKSFNLIFDENENIIYAGVNPFYLNASYLNLNNAVTEANIENLIFHNDNISTFTCNNYEDLCAIVNNTSNNTIMKYQLQGFEQVTSPQYRNLYIILPTSWTDKIFITEDSGNELNTVSGSEAIYLKASTEIKQIGKYSIIKTDGYIVNPDKVLLLPVTKWKEVTI